MKKRTLALLAALVLCVTGVVGGTLAWLTAKSGPVVNTFSPSDINIKLEETPTPNQTYKMIPGWTITKDPKVTVETGSEPCWLFVKLEESENFKDYMTFTVDESWTQGNGVDIPANVWYREIDTAGKMGVPYSVLKDNQVAVKDTVTKDDMEVIEQNNPTLTVTAYASQLYKNNTEKFSPAEAWNNVPKNNP